MNSKNVLLGVLAGVTAGALLGLLLAPDKGYATRKKFSKKGTNYLDNLKEKFNEVVDGITEKFEDVEDDANEAFEKGKSKFESYKAAARKSSMQ